MNWIKGSDNGHKHLRYNLEGKEWVEITTDYINSSLSEGFDVSTAKALNVNKDSDACCQGQTHKGKGFLVPKKDAEEMIAANPRLSEVMFPYLNADEMISTPSSLPGRYVIDFGRRDIIEASTYTEAFGKVKRDVLPEAMKAAEKEQKRNEEALADDPDAHVNKDHQVSFNKWWLLFRPRLEMMDKLSKMNRYIACGQVTKRPIFEFISTDIHPNAALMVFPMDDDYSFGILQSSVHWDWFNAKCSTLKGDPRYTSTTVFDSFPWPQWGFDAYEGHEKEYTRIIEEIANAARDLRQTRRRLMEEYGKSLRDLYRLLEEPGDNPLKPKIDRLNKAVLKAYSAGFEKVPKDSLEMLYNLNKQVFERESAKLPVFGPGIPSFVKDRDKLVSDDCVKM